MYGLHQLSEKGVELTNAHSLEAILRKLRKKTNLRIHPSKIK